MMSKFLRSEPGQDPVVLEAFFAVPVQRVFRAWTEPDEIKKQLNSLGIEQTEHSSIEEIIGITDVLYVTRIQKERMSSDELLLYESQGIEDNYTVTPGTLAGAKEKMCILHPLPRVTEISTFVDSDPRAAYFRQMKNGLFIRMALLKMMLE